MTSGGCSCFEYGAVTRYGRPFQNRSSTRQLGNSVIDQVLDVVTSAAATGKIGDGKIWVTSVDRLVRIRTGEQGADAI